MSKDTNDDKEEPQSSTGLIFAFALMIPVLYVLSVGPFAYIMTHSAMAPSGALETYLEYFYSPIQWLHDNTWLEYPLEWYVYLWL